MLHDMKYIMTMKYNERNIPVRIYSWRDTCFFINRNRLEVCDFLLDCSLLEFLQSEDVKIIAMKENCVDELMVNLMKDMDDGLLNMKFILYNIKGINQLLRFCSLHHFTKKKRTNRYMIHYLTHKTTRKKGGRYSKQS